MSRSRTIYSCIYAQRKGQRLSEEQGGGPEWMAQGRLRIDEDVQHGLENAYDAFMRLFSGANTGKLVLKIADGL